MDESQRGGRASERVPLTRIEDYTWEIPRSYKKGMRVPGRIYADQELLQKMKSDMTIEQCANVAHLPGIYKWAITLPDGHEGYGFPIGGVAATDYEEGALSPGGVGYDINCISGDSLILHELGFTLPIRHFEATWTKQSIKCIGSRKTPVPTEIARFLKIPSDKKVFRVRTELGHTIIATEDHPFLTPTGMIPLGELTNEKVAAYPFHGVPYENPQSRTIVSDRDINALHVPCSKRHLIAELRKRELIPLKSNSEKLPYLLKVMGFVLGDGVVVFTKSTHLVVFYGRREDLEDIRNDIAKLGYKPSRVYSRSRKGSIVTKYGLKEFQTTEYSIKVVGRSLPALLIAMGIPSGNKARQDFTLPSWLLKSPLWQKRLFLAALFGAELSSPSTITGHGHTFCAPLITQNKKATHVRSGLRLMKQLKKLLHDFGVLTNAISVEKEATPGKDGLYSTRLRLQISGTPKNLVRLWSTIGFEYNRQKMFLANVASSYLKLKLVLVEKRVAIAQLAQDMRGRGVRTAEIYDRLTSSDANRRFVERSLYAPRDSSARIPRDFLAFNAYLTSATIGLGHSGAVWDRMVQKEEVPFSEYVYDFTVRDSHHNFIANGFIVSNCGARLIRTNLDESDVRPHLSRILEGLFTNIPSGLGSRGKVRLSPVELDKVLSNGLDWAVDNGYGWSEDKEHCEENGCMEGADPGKVSTTAKRRGAPQLGSLGSGNHFLEIEKVDKIFAAEVAKCFGIERENQIVIMVHTGSRGFGHQVCSDYLRVMESATHRYHIELPDRELACAPSNSHEAQDYFAAMCCACNFAWSNRQMVTHWTRETFEKVLGRTADAMDMHLIYDVAHNIAKIEEHEVGSRKKVYVHRKGATRAFPAGHSAIPSDYRSTGQPVLIPGSMGTASWVLAGTEKGMDLSFGSTAHGAGRLMSRAAAKRRFWGKDVQQGLQQEGILVRAASPVVLAEEAPEAYKDVDRVVDVSHRLGIATKVARLVPIGVTKG